MTEFQQRACAVAVVKMLRGKHFNICDMDAIGKTMGVESRLSGRDYQALRTLHCVDWADMGEELAQQTREKCLEMLGLPPTVVEMVQPAEPARNRTEPAHAPAKRLRLAFWR